MPSPRAGTTSRTLLRLAHIDRAWVIAARWSTSAAGSVAAGVLVLFSKWNSSQSLRHIRDYGLPWTAVCAVLVAAAGLMCLARTRPLGYAIASVVELITAASFLQTSEQLPHANGPVMVFIFETSVFHFLGMLTALQDRQDRRDLAASGAP